MAQITLNNRQGAKGISPFFITDGYHVNPIMLPEDIITAPGLKIRDTET